MHMANEKKYSDEMLKEYISSEVELIKKKRKDPKQWKKNEEFHSQITIRVKEGDEDVSDISNGELQ